MSTMAHEGTNQIRNKKVHKLPDESVGEIAELTATALESQKTFGCERDEAVSQAASRTADNNSENARHHEILASLRRIMKR